MLTLIIFVIVMAALALVLLALCGHLHWMNRTTRRDLCGICLKPILPETHSAFCQTCLARLRNPEV